ncbi:MULTISPECIES: DUF5020 family protein [Porphyromonas]|uniref:DUF5020 domain-containing protein n=1 Tax=Porphyromonas canoris TaxID=36875 RepID=A0ABR4XP39_9PORP|nr:MULTISPECIES: DUF5020 family protein [Porphyromonas]KGL51527.1 hypothetical protein HQ29_08685 [Porphyromonas canoris]KGN66925.1 hypothetical protein JT26_10505 [Porphyromonas sp. COT-108 OH1349]KGN93273.1 hypothetical protein HQ43_01055 [Porphyromonas canoris]KGN93864.1 hypothetical protein HQ39_09690 [Porphyromonas sp. COT-108 OH2963]
MKKILLGVALLLGTLTAVGQNIQTHYQAGRHLYKDMEKTPSFVTTVEHFKADRWGQTFLFVDFVHTEKGISNSYFEIARELKFWKAPVALHLEYNGGVDRNFSINNAYLVGASYLWTSKDFSKNFSISTSYRYDQAIEGVQDANHGMQLTAVWGWNSWNRVFTLNGFVDVWTKKASDKSHGVVVYSEPQAWINLNQLVGFHDNFNLSLGTEVRLSYNFLNPNKFYALPTLAAKWTF